VGDVSSCSPYSGYRINLDAVTNHRSTLAGKPGILLLPKSIVAKSQSMIITSCRHSLGMRWIHEECVPNMNGTGASNRSSRGEGTTGKYTCDQWKGYNKARIPSQMADK
jgi:hypothetical protein